MSASTARASQWRRCSARRGRLGDTLLLLAASGFAARWRGRPDSPVLSVSDAEPRGFLAA